MHHHVLPEALAAQAPVLPRLAYSVKESAEILGLSTTTVRRLVRRGRLRTVPGLRHRLIPTSELHRFLTVRS